VLREGGRTVRGGFVCVGGEEEEDSDNPAGERDRRFGIKKIRDKCCLRGPVAAVAIPLLPSTAPRKEKYTLSYKTCSAFFPR
jgi:hypothetical protein